MPHPVDVHVGSRLRTARVAAGLSQGALAKSVGVTFQQIQKYERGTNRVSASRLYDIARFLEVEIMYFFQGIDDENGSETRDDEHLARFDLELARKISVMSNVNLKYAIRRLIDDAG